MFSLQAKSAIAGNLTAVRLYADVNGGSVNWTAFTTAYTVTNTAWGELRLAFTPLTSTGIRVAIGGFLSGGSILVASALLTEIATSPYVRTNGWQIGQNPRNIDPAENVSYIYSLDAKAGTAYSVINKTTDFVLGTAKKIINPTLQNSSLTVTYQPRDRDFVGVYDNSMNYYYAAARPTNDSITIGTDTGFRYQSSENSSETVKFTVTKSRFDFDVPGTTGAVVTMGRANTSQTYPERRSGDSLDNPAFYFTLDTKATLLYTVSGVTVQARDRDRLFVGQQSWQGNTGGFRNAGDSQERIVFLLSKDNSGRDSVAIGVSSTTSGIRTQPTESSLENIRFTTVKRPGLQGAYDTSVVTIGNWQDGQDGRAVSSSELVTFNVTKLALQGVNNTWNFGTTTSRTSAARGELVYAGDPSFANRSRLSDSTFEKVGFDFFKTAFAGSSVTWSVQLNTIDPSPDIEYQASSVTVTYGPKDLDRVGTLDRFNLFYTVGRIFDLDSITVGGDTGFRYQPTESSLEWTRFFFIKGLSDDVPMLDLAGIFDGLNSFVTIFKTEATPILDNSRFSPYPARFVTKDIGIGNHNGTVDTFYIGVSSTTSGIRTQPTESSLENTKFTFVKAPGQQGVDDTSVVTIGNWQTSGDRTVSTSELVTFNVTKLALQGTDYNWAFGTTTSRTTAARGDFAYVGDPSFAGRSRLSNSQFERIGFDYFKTAKAGSSVTWSIQVNTIDPNPDVEYQQSSITISYGPSNLDAVGSLDRFFLTLATRRTFDLDFVTIGTDTGFRYQPSESSLENVKFTVTKSRFDKDVPGTTGALVTMGRGTSSVVYPERRSGDTLDNPAFAVALDAKVDRQLASYSVSGVTVLARDRDRLFVGQQSWQGNVLGFRNSGDGQERLLYLLVKTADAVVPASVTVGLSSTVTGIRTQPTESSLENIRFTVVKRPGQQGVDDTSVVTIGNWQTSGDRTISSSELVSFNITQLAKQGTANTWSGFINNSSFTTTAGARGERVYAGDPFRGVHPLRRSGNQSENVGFDFFKTAKAGTGAFSWIIKINTIDSDPDFEWRDSSVTRIYDGGNFDEIGIWDRWWMFFGAVRLPIDSVTIGTDTGFRYQPSESSLENVKFTITKARFDKDVAGTTGAIVTISDDLNVAPGRGLSDRFTLGFGSSTGIKVAGSLLERIPFDFFKATGIGGAGSSNTVAIVGSGEDRRSALSERTFFTITKARFDFDVPDWYEGEPATTGAIVRIDTNDAFLTFSLDAKQSIDNTITGFINASSVTNLARQRDLVVMGDPFRGVYPLRRSGNQAENVSIQYTKDAKRGTLTTATRLQFIDGNNGIVSSALVTYTSSSTDVVGVFAGIVDVRNFNRLFPLYTRDSAGEVIDGQTGETEIVVPGDDSANSPYPAKRLNKRVYPDDDATTSHHLIYTSGDIETIQFTKSARRGVAGTVLLNTIDPNPDIEYRVSSIAVTQTAADVDVVGTLDYFSIYYMLYRQFDDYLTLGSGIDQRQTTTENIKFLITKLLSGDTTPMLDLTEVYDGLVYTTTLYKADTQIIASGQTSQAFPARAKSGAAEIVAFDFYKEARFSGNTITFSGNTVTTNSGDRLFVGQQYGTTRFARDPQERISFNVSTSLGNARDTSVETIAIVGSGVDDRLGYDNEKTSFAVSKARFDRDVDGTTGALVVMGRGTSSVAYPERRSDDALDNPSFNFDKSAKRGVVGAVTLKLIDPTDGNGFQSSAAVTFGSSSTDIFGTIDFMTAVVGTGRSFEDSFTIGSDTGFRYQPDESSLENTYFTIGKRATEYDGGTSFVTVGGDTGFRYQPSESDLESTKFTVTKSRFDKDVAGTTGAVVTMGRANTNQTYPERRSGDQLDNPAFDFYKTAQIRGTIPVNQAWYSPFSSVTGQAHIAYRHTDTTDPVFVGSLGYKNSADILANSSVTSIWVQQTRLATFTSGTTYTLSGYMRRPDGMGSVNVALDVGTTSFSIQATSVTVTVTNTWTRFSTPFTAPRTSITVRVRSLDTGGTDALEVFGFQINVGTSPTAYAKTTTASAGGNLLLQSEDFDNATWAKSSNTIVYANVTESPSEFWISEDWARPGDGQEEMFYTVGKQADADGLGSSLSFVTVGAGDNYGFRYQSSENSSETVKFTVTKARFDFDVPGTTGAVVTVGGDRSLRYQSTESELENTYFNINLTAKRGVAGNVTLNTIDSNPDIEFRVSSVTISRGAWQLDEVGMLDAFNLFYQITRTFDQDLVTIGTDTGFRNQPSQSSLEWTKFTIGKLLGQDDGTTMLDLTEVYDGLVYNTTMLKREALIMGFGSSTGVKVAGSLLENIPFDVFLDAKVDRLTASYTVSGVTVRARDRDRLFVGQQPWQGNTAIRNAGDRQERIFYTVDKFADSDNQGSSTAYVVMGAGDNYGFRYQASENTSETVKFTVTKSRFDFDVPGTTGAIVTIGRESTSQTYPERRSGDELDNPAFTFGLRANRGVAGSITLKLIDPANGDGGQSSGTVTYQDWDYDVVGAIDFMFVQMIGTGRAFLDSILIGSDTGFRYQPSESSLESTKFTITKARFDFDVPGTTGAIVTVGGDTGFRYQSSESDLENTYFTVTKSRFDKDVAGTTGAIVVLGRANTSQTYPERRSGDSLDNPAFDVYKTAQIRGINALNAAWYSPFSSVTGQAHTAYRHTDTEDPVFVGTLGYKNSADILANSSITSIWVQQVILNQYVSGSTYTFSGYFRRPNGGAEPIALDVGTTSFSITATSVTRSVSDSWSRVDVQFTAPRTSIAVRVRSLDTGGTDSLEVFGLQINSGNTVTSYVKTTTAIVAANRLLYSEDLDNAAWAKSSNTIVYANVTESPPEFWAGLDWARPGDSQEKLIYRFEKSADSDNQGSSTAYVVVGAGDNYGFRYQSSENTSETVKFTVTKSKFDKDVPGTTGAVVVIGRNNTSQTYPERRSGDSLDNPAFTFNKTAKRGIAGNVTLNTIDSNPDIEFRVSSVTISRGSYYPDEIGMLDAFSLFYQVTREFNQDFITIGSDTGFRNQPSQSSLEWTKFTIGKRLGQDDGTTMLDLTEVYDGLVYNTTMLKRESLTAGRGTTTVAYPERRSGQTDEIAQFLFDLDAKVDRLSASYTVSGVTVLARDRDRLFVGQQSWQGNAGGFRNAGDRQERISFAAGKAADSDGLGSSISFVTVGAGDNYGFRYQASENTSETVKFTVTKSRFDQDVPGTTGAIVTIDTNDAWLNFNLDAKQGATTTLSGTTVRARDRDRIFVGQQLWQGNQGKRVSGDALESFVVNLYKPITETSTTILDRPYLYNQRGTIYDETTILGERPGFMNMDFAAGAKFDSMEIADSLVISVLFPINVFDFPGDLDLNGNINTVASYGNLRMTDYADIDYFEDDYVGEKRSFT